MLSEELSVDAVARKNALRVIVLHLPHVGYQIGSLDQCLRRITLRDDDFDRWRPSLQGGQRFIGRKQSEMQGDGQFVENHHVVFVARKQPGAAL